MREHNAGTKMSDNTYGGPKKERGRVVKSFEKYFHPRG